MGEPKGFFTYFHHSDTLEILSDAQAGRLYKALLRYGMTGELPDLSDDAGLTVAFTLFRTEIDLNFERYREVCAKRSEAGRKGARTRTYAAQNADITSKPVIKPQETPTPYKDDDAVPPPPELGAFMETIRRR